MRSLTVTLGELNAGPQEIEFSFTQEQIEERLGDLAFPRAFHRVQGRVTLEKISGAVSVLGHMHGFLTVTCSRCLKATKVYPPESFRFTFIREPDHFDQEIELTADDLETAWFRGDTLELEPHLWDQLLLCVPMVPLCDESCEGISYYKGQEAETPKEDPRWNALKGLHLDIEPSPK